MAEDFAIGRALVIPKDVLSNLDEVDKKINKIATDSENMAAKFTSAMSKMSVGTGDLLKKLTEMQTKINNMDISKFAQGVSNVAKGVSQIEKFSNAISKAAAAINKYNSSQVKKTNVDNTKEINKLNKEIEALKKKTEQLEKYRQKQQQVNREQNSTRTNTKAIDAYNRAMASSEAIVTQRINKIAKLRQAEEMLTNASGNYEKQIKRIRQEIERLNKLNQGQVDAYGRVIKSQRNLMDTSGQLARQLALIFSVSQIEGYIMKLVKVRGEFELQNTALASILQNKDQADKLFGQITELAVKSPFTVKELTTYTKSLAAYSVEYEKLYDTTKMLADVSAGLGVDMQRLILAFGQVKAANFLRGCLGYNTPVMLYDGSIKKVQDVVVGDVLINEKGEPVNVLELIRGRETMFLVEQVSGNNRISYRVNRNHILTLWNVQEQRLEDVYVYDYLKNKDAYLGLKIVDGEKVYYDIEVTKDRIDDYYGFVLDGNKRFRLGDGTITHNTETRQFTEAGINMLGELAKYYTELEGRIVSVGEVQERQFKKMISFADVEEVFKRLTSSGGMFYEMQEKQAETLWGMMSNLQDSIDIMLNDIGKANDGTIKDMITSIRSIVQNWREVIEYMKIAASIFGPYIAYTALAKVASSKFALSILDIATKSNVATKAIDSVNIGITKLLGKSKLATIAAKGLSTVLGGIATLGVGAVLTAIVAGISYLYVEATKASRQAAELKKNLDSILSSGIYDASKLSTQFQNLANKILDSSTSAEKQNEALKELQRTYGEILPAYTLTIEGLKELKGNYDEVTKAIYSNIEAQTKEKQIQAVSDTYGQDVEDASQNLKDMLVKQAGLRPEDANYVINEVRKAIDEGLLGINDDYTAFVEGIIEENFGLTKNLKETSKTLAGSSFGGTDRFRIVEVKTQNDELTKYVQSAVKLRKEIENITSQNIVSLGSSDYRALEDSVKKSQSIISDAKKEVAEENEGQGEFFISEEQINKERELIQKWISDFKSGAIQVKNAYGNIVDPNSKTAEKFVENLQKQMDSLDGSSMQNEVRNVIREFSTLNDVSLVKLNDVLMESSQSMTDYKNSVNNNIKQIEERLQQYAAGYSGFITNIFNDADKNQAEQTLSLLKYIRSSLFPTIGTGGGESSALRRLKEQISLIKKAGDEYEKLIKYYSEEEATAKIRESFGDAFRNLGLSIDMTFDTSGIIEGIKNLQYEAIKGGKEAVDKTLAEFESEKNIKVKVDGIEEIQKQIDSIFTNYEFSLELKTAGIDADAFKNMLKSVGATDEEISLAGLDVTTFEQAQKKIRNIIKDLQKQGGKEQLDLAKKYQEQLTQLEVKEARKRFDELLTLREKYQTNEEKIAKIETDISSWQKELDDIKKFGDSANKEQQELLEMRIQDGQDAILKLKSEALQLTEFWRTLFGDLEDLSVNSLRRLSDTVDEVIGSSKEIKGNKGQIVGYSAEYTDKDGLKKQVTLTVEQYQRLLKQNNQVADEIQKKNPFIALFDAIIEGKKEGETKLDYIVRLEGILGDVSDAAFQVASDLAEIFGADEEAKELISNIKGVADGAVSLGTGIARIASGDIIGGAISAVSGIANIVSSINKIHDNKREQEIERQTRLVEDLERAYDKLYKTIENGLSIDAYSENANIIKNLTKQIESYEAMIAAEYDKKNTDFDRIRDWEDAISGIYEQIDDLYDNLKTNLVGDFKSVSQQLGDAIAEAFANGTDAAEAWGDSVKEIVADIVKNLLVQKLIEPGVQQILDQMFEDAMPKTSNADKIKEQMNALMEQYEAIGEASDIGTYVMNIYKKSEIKKQLEELKKQYEQAVAESEDEVPNLTQDIVNSALAALNQLGDDVLNNPAWDMLKDLLGQEGDTMSSLQRGIEGLSETTGQALEALLSSMRFFVSDSNTVLHNIYNAIAMPNVENPFLMELKVQSNYLNNLNTLVSSVIKNSSGKGKVLRVEIA